MSDEGEERLGRGVMGRDEVRHRALVGVTTIALRGVAGRILGFGGNLILARLLLPRDFGLVAFGVTLMTVVGFLSDAGMGASLIRRPSPPTRRELESLLGFQLLLTTAIAAASAAIALPFGQSGLVTVVMVASLPLMAFRVPGAILFERELAYRPMAAVELSETVAYFAWAITTVALGWGVWGMATGSLARAVAASGVMIKLSPDRVVRPRLQFDQIRGLLRFGLKFQAIDIVYLIYNQSLNFGIAAIAGVSALGIWSLAQRLLQVPGLFFDSLWSVSFPAMSRLKESGEDVRPIIERALGSSAVVGGIIIVGLVGPGPALVTTLFGPEWRPVSNVLPLALLGVMLAGPLTVATVGYLYAIEDAGAVLRNAAFTSTAMLVSTLGLLRPIGSPALGIGALVGALVAVAVLGPKINSVSGARVLPTVALTTGLATVSAAAGWLTAVTIGPSYVALAAGGVVAETLFVAGLVVTAWDLVVDTTALVLRAVRSSAGRPDRTTPVP